ncbi:NUDIX domain-containing protein [Rhodopirellula baltica]|uniref:(Di)nucleoside polyphosphate hydrolase n=1 Tax=Rhodopirellula baltica SWK14 TaxID=993516 RepID=L7CFZ3_RHOBT|nr:NUDIX domain-containing protein [Rhodopirellula baltica]ELP33179.1 (di)nucleoside polyphosphate hydrolase [Rhodopirellula baltica SWK14]
MLDWIKVAGKLAYDRPTRERLLGYRPVVICLIQSLERDAFLFVQPAAGRGAWMPPQEGIPPNASVEEATSQCLDVELGVSRNQMHFRRSVWLGRKAIPERQGSRDVEFSIRSMQGKAYYGSLSKVAEDTLITCNPAEVAGYEWMSMAEIRDRMTGNSDRKRDLLRVLFAKLVQMEL